MTAAAAESGEDPRPATAAAPRPVPLLPVAFLFLLSGAAGLLYEVLWSRQLARVLGGSYPSVVATVTAFLAGLALGAALGGRMAARVRRPLRAYGLLEGAVGLYCAAFPLLLAALHPAFGWCYRHLADSPALHTAARFAVAGAALLPPTIAMGATLPLLVRAAVAEGRGSVLGGTGLLYGLNTVGAAGGALLTGFVLLPALGFSGTLYVGVGANLAVAAVAILLDRSWAGAPTKPDEGTVPPAPGPEDVSPALRRAALVLAFGSGIASMLYQLGWTRALVLCFGSSVHAFTLIVATFILGLGLGGLLAPLARERGARLAGALVLLEAAVGVAGWTSAVQIANLPASTVDTVARAPSWGDLLGWEMSRALLIALPPTLAMGAAFPVTVAVLAAAGGGAPRAVGRCYAVNTLGVILGSLGGGMLLLPAVGARDAVLAAAAVNLVLAAVVAASAFPFRRVLPALVVLAGAAVAVFPLAPPWPAAQFHAGVYLYGRAYADQAAEDHRSVARTLRDIGWDMPFEAEGRSVSVAVVRQPGGGLSLRINGKADASTEGDMDTQLLLGHAPMLACPGARRVLVVGLASGVSAAAARSHGPDAVDVAEIAPEVAAAEPLFRPWNGNVTARPGVRVLLEDGRTHLEHAAETYDVIVSEPTNPWIAGVSDLFTVEYFRACRDRLAPGGVLCVWLQAYGLSVEDFRLVVRTVRSVMPNTVVWEAAPWEDYLVLASRDEGTDPAATVAGRPWPGGDAALSLGTAGLRAKEGALALQFLDRAGTAAFAEGGSGRDLHTDDRLQLEFRAPRTVFSPGDEPMLTPAVLDAIRSPGDVEGLAGVDAPALRAALEARALGMRGLRALRAADAPRGGAPILDPVLRDPAALEAALPGVPPSFREELRAAAGPRSNASPPTAAAEWLLRAQAIRDLEAASLAGCRELWVLQNLAHQRSVRAQRESAESDGAAAEADLLRVRELEPRDAMAPYLLASLRLKRAGAKPSREDLEASLRLAEESLALNPRCEAALAHRGTVLHALGRDEEAVRALEETLAVRPDSIRALGLLALLRRGQDRADEARALLDAALSLEPESPGLRMLRRQFDAAR